MLAWSAIVPHTLLPLLGASADLSHAIGLVLSDRDPPSPMASALLSATLDFQLPRNWRARASSRRPEPQRPIAAVSCAASRTG